MRTRRGGRATAFVLAALLLLSLVPPTTSSDYIYPYDPLEHSYLEELTSWRHPDGGGEDLFFNCSMDGSKLVLIGYAAPDDVRVTDRDLDTLAVLEPPGEPFEAKGAKWSKTDRWVAVWGRVAGADSDVLTIYDGSSLEPAASVPWTRHVDLAVIDSICFFAGDNILMVGGRDEQGTSLLYIVETHNDDVLTINEWPGNHSILHMGEDSRHIMLVDSGGTITHYNGNNWTFLEKFEGALGTPTAWFVHWDKPWAFGDEDGLAVVAYHLTYHPEFNITAGEGPVQGISQSLDRIADVLIATGQPEGGSRLSAWQLFDEGNLTDLQELCSLELDANVTMMEPAPGGPGRTVVAFDDGTLAVYRLDVRSIPISLDSGDPDQEDGNGLETLMLWRHPSGKGEGMTFTFNHAGSLVLLQEGPYSKDLWIVNRSFETIGTIELEEGFNLGGHRWSSTDSWLAVWGWNDTNGAQKLDIYDIPSLVNNTTLEIGWIWEHVMGIATLEFLAGDRILAVSGTGRNMTSKVWFLDLKNRTVVREHTLNYTEYYNYDAFEVVGDSLVCFSRAGKHATFSLDTYDLIGNGTGSFSDYTFYDQSSDEWLFLFNHFNLSYHEGGPGNHGWTWSDECPYITGFAWTQVRDGDLLLTANFRLTGGTEVHFWRNVGTEGREGMRLVSILNTSFEIICMAVDPAYPGLVAASTSNGRFVLYHVNVSGYPPAPTEIGGIPINGSIDWTDGDENGDNGDNGNITGDGDQDAWGSSPVGPIMAGLLLAIVALLAVYVWLRRKDSGAEKRQEQ